MKVPELSELSFHGLDVHHAHLVSSLLLQFICMRLPPTQTRTSLVLLFQAFGLVKFERSTSEADVASSTSKAF